MGTPGFTGRTRGASSVIAVPEAAGTGPHGDRDRVWAVRRQTGHGSDSPARYQHIRTTRVVIELLSSINMSYNSRKGHSERDRGQHITCGVLDRTEENVCPLSRFVFSIK